MFLGTVPVESDGSAYFRAPAGKPIYFQAVDADGRAVQSMRSVTYLQPGEQASCVGCHEHRTTAPTARTTTLAGHREPSPIIPGPDGSKPFSYALLVQPIDAEPPTVRGKDGRYPVPMPGITPFA